MTNVLKGDFNMNVWYRIFLKHPKSTTHPQGYWTHGMFSVVNSIKLVWYALLGIVHGVIPCLFPFNTSSAIIRSFVKLVRSERHKKELERYVTEDVKKFLT